MLTEMLSGNDNYDDNGQDSERKDEIDSFTWNMIAKPKPFKCVECNLCYESSEQLKIHVYQKHDVKMAESKPFKCVECNECYESGRKLIAHVKQEHAKSFECFICQKSFKSLHRTQIHLREHVHGRRTNLQINRPILVARRRLQMQNMATPKPFKCVECNLCFRFSRNLKMHVKQVHPNLAVRKFECYMCRER